jgi:hypothetical protein
MMKFEEALAKMREGNSVRRDADSWEDLAVYIYEGEEVNGRYMHPYFILQFPEKTRYSVWTPSTNDIFAENWITV